MPPLTPPAALTARLVPLAEVVTVGLPFCAFKLLTGLVLLQLPAFRVLGFLLLACGAVDLLINLLNVGSLAFTGRRVLGVCLTDVLLRSRERTDLGIALDVFLSFGLVAVVIGGGLLLRLPGWALACWNAAVILNVLGAGIGRLLSALRRRGTSG